LFGYLSDTCGSKLPDEGISVLEAVQDLGEDLCLNNVLGEVDGVPGDVGEA
jgi:hypothetical protein